MTKRYFNEESHEESSLKRSQKLKTTHEKTPGYKDERHTSSFRSSDTEDFSGGNEEDAVYNDDQDLEKKWNIPQKTKDVGIKWSSM